MIQEKVSNVYIRGSKSCYYPTDSIRLIRLLMDIAMSESPEVENRFFDMASQELSRLFHEGSFEGLQINALAALWVGCVKYGISDHLCSRYISVSLLPFAPSIRTH